MKAEVDRLNVIVDATNIEFVVALKEQNTRLRKALDRAKEGLNNIQYKKAIAGNEKLSGCEEFYRGYNGGINTQYERSSNLAEKTLTDIAKIEGEG